jgi:hypothetical protein
MPAGKHSYGDPVVNTPFFEGPEGPFNEDQQRRLRVTCQHIDMILSDIENALNESASKAAFPTYISDITPKQQKTVEDFIAYTRSQLTQSLENQGISRNPPSIPVSRAIRSRLYSIDIAAEEIRPRHMRGYGKVSAPAATELTRFAEELQTRADELHHDLTKGKNDLRGPQP